MKYNVNGNTDGVREAMLARLDALYTCELEEDEFLPRELMKLLAECSCALNREIAVYITRDGEIVNVAIGTDSDVELTDYRLRPTRTGSAASAASTRIRTGTGI